MPNNDSNYIQTYNHPHGQVLINEQTLTDIADAIREQRLTDDRFKPTQFAEEILGINEIEGGEYEGEIDLSVEEKDVNFYDYDGTRVYSYGKEEFLDLSSLPDNPSHDNLIAQGWNWNLNEAKSYVQNYNKLNIGQIYNTVSSFTHFNSILNFGWLEIDIQLKEGYLSPVITLNTHKGYVESETIYWGDGSSTSDDINDSISHTYSKPGKYTIIIQDDDQSYLGLSYEITGTSSGSNLLTGGGTNDDIYRNCITAVRIGDCVKTLGSYAFKECNSLRTITLPQSLEGIEPNCFQNCFSLKSITLPKTGVLNVLDEQCFLNCYSLKSVILPSFEGSPWYFFDQIFQNCHSLDAITISGEVASGFPLNCFAQCQSLQQLTIPLGIINFDNTIFTNCYSLKRINCYPITPPTVTSTTFTGLPIYTKIYVPWSRDHSVLQAYKTATYWSDIADQIYQMPMNENIQIYEAYAEFDSSDGSLTFFRDLPNKYTNNEVQGTKTYYTGIETTNYTSTPDIPWYSNRTSVTSVIFENKIIPISTAYWFNGMNNANFTSIIGLENFDTSNVTSMSYMFYNCQSLTSLDLSHFDTSNVTDMKDMFNYCQNLISLDISHFNTSNITSMYQMFYNCQSLTSLDVSHFDTSNVTIMTRMFYNCQSLTSLDVSHFDTSNVTSMYSTFYNCRNLTSLDVSHFDTSNVNNMYDMFYNCQSLTSLDVSHFDTNSVTNMYQMFNNCQNLTSLDLSHFDTSKVTDMTRMFNNCKNLTTTLNIMKMPTNYGVMCYNAATVSGSQITLKYISPVTSTDIDTLVATKSSSSNVINGGQGTFVPPTPPTPPTPVGGAS